MVVRRLVIMPDDLLIARSLNFNIDYPSNTDGNEFLLPQDVLITRNTTSVLQNMPDTLDPVLCDFNDNSAGDHYVISTCLQVTCKEPPKERKSITFRRTRHVDADKVRQNLANLLVLYNLHGLLNALTTIVR